MTPILGLHTQGEQVKAFLAAQKAFAVGLEAKNNGDDATYHYSTGYLNAILDLAAMENSNRLVRQVRGLIEELTGIRV